MLGREGDQRFIALGPRPDCGPADTVFGELRAIRETTQPSATSRVGPASITLKGAKMRNLLLAATASLVIAVPATARDNSGYIGIEGGVMFPKNTHIDGSVDFTDPDVADITSRRAATVKYKTGY
ncbi:MAG: hypothetical protein ACREBM_08000, partial [Sphingomicrobium sp.]